MAVARPFYLFEAVFRLIKLNPFLFQTPVILPIVGLHRELIHNM